MSNWLNITSTQIHLCGRYGKILQRFSLDQEDAAREALHELMGDRRPALQKPSLTAPERNLLERLAGREATVWPGIGERVRRLQSRNLLKATEAEGGYRVEITDRGRAAL